MNQIFALIAWWVTMMLERVASLLANLSKELIWHIDHYLLPIYQNPFIAADIKPPTVSTR